MKRVDNYTIGTAKARSGDVVKSWGYLCVHCRGIMRGAVIETRQNMTACNIY